jgi:hypothetical protein
MNTEWYEKVAVLTKRRDKAKHYLEQGQQVLDETEGQLRELALESIQGPVATTETATENGGEWTMVRSEQGA